MGVGHTYSHGEEGGSVEGDNMDFDEYEEHGEVDDSHDEDEPLELDDSERVTDELWQNISDGDSDQEGEGDPETSSEDEEFLELENTYN